MRYLLLALLASTLATTSQAYEGLPTAQVKAFFAELGSGKINQAVDNLYSSNPAMQEKAQALNLLKQQLNSVQALYGEFIGAESLSHEKLSASIIRIVQAAKHEKHPIIWEFYFYKPRDTWIISQAVFGDQFQTLGSKQ